MVVVFHVFRFFPELVAQKTNLDQWRTDIAHPEDMEQDFVAFVVKRADTSVLPSTDRQNTPSRPT